MPKLILTSEDVAVCRVLQLNGWSRARIGGLFSVDQSTVTHAIRHRKTHLPDMAEKIMGSVMAKVLVRINRATRKTVARELHKIAKELETIR